VEGQRIEYLVRFPERREQLEGLAEEMAGLRVDVIITRGTAEAKAAASATKAISIVMAGIGDPVGEGLVRSLARPGGNITGLSNFSPQLTAKRIQFIKEAMPSTKRIGIGCHRG
jgi:putative tryptophan/tyrosine transport system substrate-binding protein